MVNLLFQLSINKRIAIIIKIEPPIILEYEPIFLPMMLPRVSPKYVKNKLVNENIIDDIR